MQNPLSRKKLTISLHSCSLAKMATLNSGEVAACHVDMQERQMPTESRSAIARKRGIKSDYLGLIQGNFATEQNA